MVLTEVLWCCKAVVGGGIAAGICNTVYQSIPRRHLECGACNIEREKSDALSLWNVANTLQWFACGAVVTAGVAPPVLSFVQGLAVIDGIEVFLITNALFSPLHAVVVWPSARRHLARRVPMYLSGGLFSLSVSVLSASAVFGWTDTNDAYFSTAITVAGGCLVFLQFCFTNKLAVAELHFLYHSVLPRQRDDPEVDSFAGLIRFCQIWGNLAVLLLLYGLVGEPQGSVLYNTIFETSLSDVLVCNILFLGLFHHMQAIESTREEKMLHHGTWVAFVPATFFSGANILIPIACAALFLLSYEPYWRAMEKISRDNQELGDLPQVVVPAAAQPLVPPAQPAQPAEPAEPAAPASEASDDVP